VADGPAIAYVRRRPDGDHRRGYDGRRHRAYTQGALTIIDAAIDGRNVEVKAARSECEAFRPAPR